MRGTAISEMNALLPTFVEDATEDLPLGESDDENMFELRAKMCANRKNRTR